LVVNSTSSHASEGETLPVEAKSFAVPKVVPEVFQGDVRNLPQVVAEPMQFNSWETEEPPDLKPPVAERSNIVPNIASAVMPSPLHSFNGLSFNSTVTGGQAGAGLPPDVNGDVGPNHYIEAVNNAYAIYNKSGTLLAAFTENALWSGAGTTPCNGSSRGDPVVLHDGLADRWILTHLAFAFNASGVPVSPFYQCFAVSRSSDPVGGGWFLYAIRMDPGAAGQPPVGTLNDYPKFGLWTDCLYMTANGYDPAHFIGTIFASLSRSDMYAGAALNWGLGFISNTTDPFTMIPSNILGTSAGSLPPSGRPNFFVSQSRLAFQFEVRKFTVPASCGGGGTLSAATNVSETSYTSPGLTSIPQPGTTNKLASLGDRLMQKVQYRKVGNAESLWIVHSTQNGSAGAVQPQWAQLNVTGGTIATAPVQQQIYAPDTNFYRWMPGLAVDGQGNMALGYSRSNGTSPNFPSIAYSGRLVSDPLNNLPQTETLLVAGSGSQNIDCGSPASGLCDRWGDYTAMSVDPADDCTFWYIDEYYSSQSNGNSGNWQTRIGSFKFPTCGQTVTAPSVTTNAATSVSQTGATLGGSVNPHGSSTNAYFEWGTTTSYGSTTFTQNVGSGTTSVPYSVSLGSLVCATTYHYRGVASNSGGTGFGGDQSFTTSSCPVTAPSVTTNAATSVGQTGATLGGSVNPHGSSTNAYFEWGTTTSYGSTTFTQNVGSGTTSVPYSVSLGSLVCATTYHYRGAASNTGGTGFGGDQSFTTSSCPVTAPTVTTNAATGVGKTGATLGGSVNPHGSSTNAYFEWGTTTSYGSTTFTQSVGSGTSAIPYSVSLGSLVCATTYHYRGAASNSGGTGFGGDQSLTTNACSNSGFSTVIPCRLLDTRSSSPLDGGSTYEVDITGFCGVPSTARAVSANITVVGATAGGFMAFWPAQTTFPGTTTISFGAGQIRANNAILVLAPGFFGAAGAVWVEPNLGASGTVQLIIDVSGYFE
jgi:hypothetical protein